MAYHYQALFLLLVALESIPHPMGPSYGGSIYRSA